MARLIDAILNRVKPVEPIGNAPAPPFKGPIYGAAAPGNIPGLVAPGNTDLSRLPVIANPDGSHSTVYSTGFQDEKPSSPYFGKEVLAKGIVNGQRTDDANAVRQQYYKTGQHLGIFSTPESSSAYGEKLHNEWGSIPGVQTEADTGQPKNVLGKTPLPRSLAR